MKIKRQEERVIKKKEETEIPVENDTVLPFFGKRNGEGKPSGKATETGSSGNGMGGWGKKGILWKTAGYVQKTAQTVQQLSDTGEEEQNPYLDERVIQMLSYVSASEKNSKQKVPVSESDTEKPNGRSTDAKRESTGYRSGSEKMAYGQEERDAPANQKQEFPYAKTKTDEYASGISGTG